MCVRIRDSNGFFYFEFREVLEVGRDGNMIGGMQIYDDVFSAMAE